jgi:hypothetical protein
VIATRTEMSVPNVAVIVLMPIVFALAIVLAFPGHGVDRVRRSYV